MTNTPIDLPDAIDEDDADNGIADDAPSAGMLPPMRLALFIAGGITLDWLIPINFGHWWGAFGLVLLIYYLRLSGGKNRTLFRFGLEYNNAGVRVAEVSLI